MIRPKIMIVEDEPLASLFLIDIVDSHGWEIAGPFRSNAEASQHVVHSPPDLAILDFQLGDENSARTAVALSEANVPFVILSGHPKQDDIGFAPADWLEKPITETELLRSLTNALGQKSVENSLSPHANSATGE
jgi:DNA-binding response OmpR family regulator